MAVRKFLAVEGDELYERYLRLLDQISGTDLTALSWRQ